MNSGLQRYTTDPSRRLEAVFRDIERTRMAGLPILNGRLAVAAIGFTPWQGHWLGTLITPWFLNLVLVPGARGAWRNAAEGKRVIWKLPSGECGFYGSFEPAFGEYHAASVCSPMSSFPDQAAAVAVAQRSLDVWLAVPQLNDIAASATDDQRRRFLRRMFVPGVR